WQLGPYNYRAAMTPRVDRIVQTLIDIGRDRGRTPAQVAIAWCLSHDPVAAAIVGSDSVADVAENISAAGCALGDAGRTKLDEISEGMELTVTKDAPEGYQPQAQEIAR